MRGKANSLAADAGSIKGIWSLRFHFYLAFTIYDDENLNTIVIYRLSQEYTKSLFLTIIQYRFSRQVISRSTFPSYN